MHDLLNNQLSLLAGCDLYADVATVWGVFVFDFLTRMKAKKATRNLWPFSHYCLQIAYQQAQHLDYQSLLYWCGGANGTWIMSCRLQPGSDEWCCRCLLWSQRSWRIGGLKACAQPVNPVSRLFALPRLMYWKNIATSQVILTWQVAGLLLSVRWKAVSSSRLRVCYDARCDWYRCNVT